MINVALALKGNEKGSVIISSEEVNLPLWYRTHAPIFIGSFTDFGHVLWLIFSREIIALMLRQGT